MQHHVTELRDLLLHAGLRQRPTVYLAADLPKRAVPISSPRGLALAFALLSGGCTGGSPAPPATPPPPAEPQGAELDGGDDAAPVATVADKPDTELPALKVGEV